MNGAGVMTVTPHNRTTFSRCAQAMYARRENALGHLLSAVAATPDGGRVPIQMFDRAMSAYCAWLAFDEPKPAPAEVERARLQRIAEETCDHGPGRCPRLEARAALAVSA